MPTRCGHPTKKVMLNPSRRCKKGNQTSYFIKNIFIYRSSGSFRFTTLKYRRLRGDMVEVFTITKHIYDHKVAPELTYNIDKVTTGNDIRLLKSKSHHDILKNIRSLIE